MTNDKHKAAVWAPNYYNEFHCIADKCRHSCCIDWEICIDSTAYEKYKGIDGILDSITDGEDGPCFKLREDGRCPHLCENGLCEIILSHGEEYLCEICKRHPRFYNSVNRGYVEAGLGIVCEEACRLVLENEKPFSLCQTNEVYPCEENLEPCFDALTRRAHIVSVIEGDGSFGDKLDILINEYKIPEILTPDEWLEQFLSLEILDSAWEKMLAAMKGKILFADSSATVKYERYYMRLLTYFVYRHLSLASSETDFRARLAFSVLSVKMIKAIFEAQREQTLEALIDISRRYSAEIEYSEYNTSELIFAYESELLG